MVKASERVKAYRPRAPHKEGCMCSVCKAKRGRMEPLIEPEVVAEPKVVAPPPPPTEVRLDSLANKSRCRIRGEENLVKEHIEGMVVCYNLAISDTVTLGGSTMVEPIK